MVAKSKVKRKPNPFLKKENKKARNVKQIVRIYLDERKKANNSKPRASKQIERAPFQNPLNGMFRYNNLIIRIFIQEIQFNNRCQRQHNNYRWFIKCCKIIFFKTIYTITFDTETGNVFNLSFSFDKDKLSSS